MSYRVFARKYRPQTFEQVVGQDHITATLQNAIRQDRVAQAYLLVGPRGIGKTSTARIFAKALNCEKGPTPTPCCQCAACQEIAEGNNLDVIEIDGASNNGVENIRDLRDNAQYSPVKGPFKIYLIDEVHMLSTGAFNALLKTLEEPPPHVKFLFATTEAQKVPATITSRCQRFDLRRISEEAIAGHLQTIAEKEKVKLEPAAAEAIARGADGGLRDAESMLDQVISFCGDHIQAVDVLDVFGFTSREIIRELGESILQCDAQTALEIVAAQDDAGKDLARLIGNLISHLRDLLIVQAIGSGEEDTAQEAELVSREKLLELLDHFAACEGRLRWATNKRMQVEVAIIKAVHLIEQASLSEVIETIASLRDGAPPPEIASSNARPARPARPAPSRQSTTSTSAPAESAPSTPQKTEPPIASTPQEPQSPPPADAKPPSTPSQPEPESNAEAAAETELPSASSPSASVDPAGVWGEVAARFVAESPLACGWLAGGVFQVEANGRMVVEFPASDRDCAEGMIWAPQQKSLDQELSNALGKPIHFHPEFLERLDPVPTTHQPEQTAPPPSAAASEDPPPSTTPEKDDKMEAFKNDPLIREALKLFEAEIVTTEKA